MRSIADRLPMVVRASRPEEASFGRVPEVSPKGAPRIAWARPKRHPPPAPPSREGSLRIRPLEEDAFSSLLSPLEGDAFSFFLSPLEGGPQGGETRVVQ